MDKYLIKSHPTEYHGTVFRSRLEARYAAYFDLCGFKWEYEPIDLDGWTPDFRVEVRCEHSECGTWSRCSHPECGGSHVERDGSHEFWVEIKPYGNASDFDGHALQRFNRPYEFAAIGLGLNPWIETVAEFCHGDGGGEYGLSSGWHHRFSSESIDDLWAEAGNRTRYRPPGAQLFHVDWDAPLNEVAELRKEAEASRSSPEVAMAKAVAKLIIASRPKTPDKL